MLEFLNSDHLEIWFNGHEARDFGAFVMDPIIIPKPEEQIETFEIPGRNGSIAQRTGKYKDIQITINFGVHSRENGFAHDCTKIRKWLAHKGMEKLRFSDAAGSFYKVRYVVPDGIERVGKTAGTFSAVFVCDPFIYFGSGETIIDNPSTLINQYGEASAPVYEITGNGLCTLTVNGKQFKIQTGGQTTAVIDTDRMIAYIKDTGVVNNTMASGKYEDLMLHPGENTFSITSGFTFKVIPNWRSL